MGLPWWLNSKESAFNAWATGDKCLIPGLGRSPGRGHDNLLRYSFLENPMDGVWLAAIYSIAELDMTEAI